MTDADPGGARVGDAAWRAGVHRAQEQAIAGEGRVVVSCTAAVGVGGLGRHVQEIVETLERSQRPWTRVGVDEDAAPLPPAPALMALAGALAKPLGRRSPSLRLWRMSVAFDSRAARALPPGEHVLGFNGTSLAQLRRGAAQGRSLALVSATVHVEQLLERHAAARRQYPLERSWARAVRRRNLREYELAQRIFVSSQSVRESFLVRGVAAERLVTFPLTPAPRYQPPRQAPQPDTFDVVYVGGLTVDKGVPVLVDAFRRVPGEELRLRLVGGWKTPAMRRFLGEAMAADARIDVVPGDPLEPLQRAGAYVHPAYSDGFGYAPAEAMACGVPVIVSEDTGMRELVRAGRGLVLATGDVDALAEAIAAAYRGEAFPAAPEVGADSRQRTS